MDRKKIIIIALVLLFIIWVSIWYYLRNKETSESAYNDNEYGTPPITYKPPYRTTSKEELMKAANDKESMQINPNVVKLQGNPALLKGLQGIPIID